MVKVEIKYADKKYINTLKITGHSNDSMVCRHISLLTESFVIIEPRCYEIIKNEKGYFEINKREDYNSLYLVYENGKLDTILTCIAILRENGADIQFIN